jgi:hypothetical protein
VGDLGMDNIKMAPRRFVTSWLWVPRRFVISWLWIKSLETGARVP